MNVTCHKIRRIRGHYCDIYSGLFKAKYVGERKVNLFGIFLPFREVMTTSLTHEWNTNPDPHLYLRCLAVLLILVTQRGPVRPTIVYHESERFFSRKSSLKYWWAGNILILGSSMVSVEIAARTLARGPRFTPLFESLLCSDSSILTSLAPKSTPARRPGYSGKQFRGESTP